MKKAHVALLVLTLASCSKPVTFQPIGGSKSDGTVELGYEFGSFDKPVTDPEQGHQAAQARCMAWGYGDAEPFGMVRTTCEQPGGFSGCARTLVTMKYQCTDKAKP